MRFSLRPDGVAEASTRTVLALQGYTGIVQGGVAAAMLDSAMVNCIFLHTGDEAVTVEMTVRYLAEIPIGAELRVEGALLRVRRSVYWACAALFHGAREMARAEAKFMKRMVNL